MKNQNYIKVYKQGNYLLCLSILFTIITSCNEREDAIPAQGTCDIVNFRFYQGERVELGDVSRSYLLLGIDSSYSDAQISAFIAQQEYLDSRYNFTIHRHALYQFSQIPVKFRTPKTCEEISTIIEFLEQQAIIAYVHPTFETELCTDAIGRRVGQMCVKVYTSSFLVRVSNPNDLTDLDRLIRETNTELVGANRFMPNWLEVRATKTAQGDALVMANHFHESGLVEISEPTVGIYPVR